MSEEWKYTSLRTLPKHASKKARDYVVRQIQEEVARGVFKELFPGNPYSIRIKWDHYEDLSTIIPMNSWSLTAYVAPIQTTTMPIIRGPDQYTNRELLYSALDEVKLRIKRKVRKCLKLK